MNVLTHYIAPPVPTRVYDWMAVSDDFDEGDPTGYGPTELAAIADLMTKQGATCEQVAQVLANHGYSEKEVSKLMNGEMQ